MRKPQTYDNKIAKGYKVICGKRVGKKKTVGNRSGRQWESAAALEALTGARAPPCSASSWRIRQIAGTPALDPPA